MKTASMLLLLLFVAGKPKVDKKAMKAIHEADALIYRPLDQGLESVSLTFGFQTEKGKMKCLWSYRRATKDRAKSDERRVLNVGDPSLGAAYAAKLTTEYGLVTYPVLLTSLASRARGMDVAWKGAGNGSSVLTPAKGTKTDVVKIVISWNDKGLPEEIVETKRAAKGGGTVERDTTFEWTRIGDLWHISFLSSVIGGRRMMGRYEYKAVNGIYLPKKITEISPLRGNSTLKMEDLKVNERSDSGR